MILIDCIVIMLYPQLHRIIVLVVYAETFNFKNREI